MRCTKGKRAFLSTCGEGRGDAPGERAEAPERSWGGGVPARSRSFLPRLVVGAFVPVLFQFYLHFLVPRLDLLYPLSL